MSTFEADPRVTEFKDRLNVFCGKCGAEVVEPVDVGGVITPQIHEGQLCGADLIGPGDVDTVTCRECGTVWPTADVENWLLDKARDEWMPVRDIVDALRAHGENITL